MGYLNTQLVKRAGTSAGELALLASIGGAMGISKADKDNAGKRKSLDAILGGLGGASGAVAGTIGGEALVNSLDPAKVGKLSGTHGKIVNFLKKNPRLAKTLGIATLISTPALGIGAGAHAGTGLSRFLSN